MGEKLQGSSVVATCECQAKPALYMQEQQEGKYYFQLADKDITASTIN